jgi:hypothetical protein
MAVSLGGAGIKFFLPAQQKALSPQSLVIVGRQLVWFTATDRSVHFIDKVSDLNHRNLIKGKPHESFSSTLRTVWF